MRRLAASIAASFALSLSATSVLAATRPQCTAPLTVGFRIVTFGSLKTAVWYPAVAPENPYAYFGIVGGSVAFNAPPAPCGTFPMVVFSHGYTGCGTQAVFITEQLARNGYIVAAPDHADHSCGVDGTTITPVVTAQPSDPANWTDQTLVNRRNDIANVITGMLASPDFGPAIDPARLAGMGHSFGGYTIQGMIGGWHAWLDPRIRAALLLSPYSEPFLVQGNLPGMKVPVMYQGGTLDYGITPFIAQPGGSYDDSPAPKFFAEFTGADHLLWTNKTCFQAGTVAACLATVPDAARVVGYALAFLNRYLVSQDEPLLWGPGTNLADYRHAALATAVPAAGFGAGAPIAPDSIFSLFGEGFSPGPAAAGVTVRVIDSAGAARIAQLFFESANQINGLLPAGTALGKASIEVSYGAGVVGLGKVQVAAVSPGIFTASSAGAAAGQAITVRGATQTIQSLTGANGVPKPVDLGAGDVYLVLYGTGLRGASQPALASIGSFSVPILYAGPQNRFPGLDQVNLGPVPRGLAGSGSVPILLTAGTATANRVTVTFR